MDHGGMVAGPRWKCKIQGRLRWDPAGVWLWVWVCVWSWVCFGLGLGLGLRLRLRLGFRLGLVLSGRLVSSGPVWPCLERERYYAEAVVMPCQSVAYAMLGHWLHYVER